MIQIQLTGALLQLGVKHFLIQLNTQLYKEYQIVKKKRMVLQRLFKKRKGVPGRIVEYKYLIILYKYEGGKDLKLVVGIILVFMSNLRGKNAS